MFRPDDKYPYQPTASKSADELLFYNWSCLYIKR